MRRSATTISSYIIALYVSLSLLLALLHLHLAPGSPILTVEVPEAQVGAPQQQHLGHLHVLVTHGQVDHGVTCVSGEPDCSGLGVVDG